jgi:lipopolysaccharide/colanic/teichoic acid biosynthesis glycosyltransferase
MEKYVGLLFKMPFMRMYVEIVKPLIDFVIALVAVVLLTPVFILVAIAIKLDSPGPVFFLQERLGKNGRVFRIVKFRSMRTDIVSYKYGEVLTEKNPQITKIGKFIRKTSIDELPQLFNIIKSEMCFIGPRPPLTTYPKAFNEYNEYEIKRFEVRPGISGLAAIKQRQIHNWSLNIPIDVEYVENISFKLDLSLFISSVLVFFKTDNIYSK